MRAQQFPTFLICRDLVTWLRRTVSFLEECGQSEIYLIDNDSTYPKLLAYYSKTPHTVVRLGTNLGKRGPWEEGIIQKYAQGRRFIVSDPDIIGVESCPRDLFDRCSEILDGDPVLRKVGPSLILDDIPKHYAFRRDVIERESQFWENERLLPGGFASPIDTTMALYRESESDALRTAPAIRLAPPYIARHLPWYIDSVAPSRELAYYRKRAGTRFGGYAKEKLPDRYKKKRRLAWDTEMAAARKNDPTT